MASVSSIRVLDLREPPSSNRPTTVYGKGQQQPPGRVTVTSSGRERAAAPIFYLKEQRGFVFDVPAPDESGESPISEEPPTVIVQPEPAPPVRDLRLVAAVAAEADRDPDRTPRRPIDPHDPRFRSLRSPAHHAHHALSTPMGIAEPMVCPERHPPGQQHQQHYPAMSVAPPLTTTSLGRPRDPRTRAAVTAIVRTRPSSRRNFLIMSLAIGFVLGVVIAALVARYAPLLSTFQ